ncbi:YwdI family protein [Neobacillus jeddahensis]|uniref:YwdI family protein n=1 Tax=Neobacillus jeddahensis TaxID=1461580 RepID=UPI00058F2304|nr:YwdI family protein [Neobacillus jeddahensis]
MSITVQTLLAKMEEELRQAKSSTKQEGLREKVYSIKILCELILEEKQTGRETQVTATVPLQPLQTQPVYAPQPVMNQQVFPQAASLQQPKKIDMEDEANGDSLFDF